MKSKNLLPFMLLSLSIAQSFAQTFVSSNISSSTLVASSFISDSVGWLADNNAKLWHSVDSAQTWDSLPTGHYFLKLEFVNSLKGFALSNDSAFKSTNGGSTWSNMGLPGAVGKAIYFLNKDTGFISGKIGIYKTTNGGVAWSTVSTDTVTFMDFYFLTKSLGFAAANDKRNFKSIWRTTNSGATWTSIFDTADYFINSIWFTTSDTGWAVGYLQTTGLGKKPLILRTTNAGTN